jgi:C1A family cysteine protease
LNKINNYIENKGNYLGGHAMLLVWWDEANDEGKILNSWGDWGNNGYAKITRDQLQNNLIDAWRIIK